MRVFPVAVRYDRRVGGKYIEYHAGGAFVEIFCVYLPYISVGAKSSLGFKSRDAVLKIGLIEPRKFMDGAVGFYSYVKPDPAVISGIAYSVLRRYKAFVKNHIFRIKTKWAENEIFKIKLRYAGDFIRVGSASAEAVGLIVSGGYIGSVKSSAIRRRRIKKPAAKNPFNNENAGKLYIIVREALSFPV